MGARAARKALTSALSLVIFFIEYSTFPQACIDKVEAEAEAKAELEVGRQIDVSWVGRRALEGAKGLRHAARSVYAVLKTIIQNEACSRRSPPDCRSPPCGR